MEGPRHFHQQSDVALSLLKQLISSEAKDSNLVFSPLSFYVVLAMVTAGSNGPTRDQLLRYLKATSVDELQLLSSQVVNLIFADGGPLGGPILSVANGVWVDQSLILNPDFKVVLQSSYRAVSSNVDFQKKAVEVMNTVNSWAEKETNGLIKDILPPGSVNALTRLILANAVYFKGAWAKKFDPSMTKDCNFYLLDESSIQVPFMTSKKKQYASKFDDFKVLGLPYKAGQDNRSFTMYFFLPDAKDGLPSLVEKMSSESGFIEHHIPYDQVSLGEFRVPKFSISSGFDASEVLKKHGLVLPFSNEANLSKMTDSPDSQKLYVSKVFHKSFIEVNEEGAEAAAVSTVVVAAFCLRLEEKFDFVADHPFIFAIREDNTGAVLFIGQVLNPLDLC